MAGQILYDDGQHRCIAFGDLVQGSSGIQANQFLILDTDDFGQTHGAIIDPGVI